jgi:hypothetical protein
MDANGLAARLGLDLDAVGICHACLSFVFAPVLRAREFPAAPVVPLRRRP